MAFLGKEFGVGKARTDHEEGVALGHHLVTRPRAEEPDRAGHEWQFVRQGCFAEQCLGDTGAELVGGLDDLVRGVQRPGPDQHRHLFSLVEHPGGAFEIFLCRHNFGCFIPNAGEDGAVFLRWQLDSVHLLQVVRHDYASDTALGLGDAHGAVDQLADLRRLGRHMDVFAGNILEQGDQIDLLLVMATQRSARLLADNRQHRLMIHLRVVEAIQQVDGAGPGGGQAYADIAGEFGVTARHKGRHLLMPHLDEIELVASAVERPDEPVDPVTGKSKDALYAPAG